MDQALPLYKELINMRPTIEQLSAENWKAISLAEKNRQTFEEIYQLTMQLTYLVKDLKDSPAWPQYHKKVQSIITVLEREVE